VWRGLGGFRGEAKLSTWVFQIAWNYLRLHRRKTGRQKLVLVPTNDDGERMLERTPDPGPDPERRATSSDLLDRVEEAIDRLPESFRIILWLRDGEGRSYDEIAAILDVPIGTVRSRLSRARQALKREVGT
jgi:RNA polymerase sigma-70 factor (ECF subfamily)